MSSGRKIRKLIMLRLFAALAGLTTASFPDFGLRLDPPVNVLENKDDTAKAAITRVGQTLTTAARVSLPIIPSNVIDSVSEKLTGKVLKVVEQIEGAEWVNAFGLPCDPNKSRVCHPKEEEKIESDDDSLLALWDRRQKRRQAAAASEASQHSLRPRNPYLTPPDNETGVHVSPTDQRVIELADELEFEYRADHEPFKQSHNGISVDTLDFWLLRGSSEKKEEETPVLPWHGGWLSEPTISPSRLTAWRQLQQQARYRPAHENVVHVSQMMFPVQDEANQQPLIATILTEEAMEATEPNRDKQNAEQEEETTEKETKQDEAEKSEPDAEERDELENTEESSVVWGPWSTAE